MDAIEAARQAREREATSKSLQARAKTDPRPTGKGGGFQSNAPGSGSDKAADAPGKYDGGLSGGVIHSAEQEQNVRTKAEKGAVITNDDIDGPRAYLGNKASDEVLRQGHNAMGKVYTPGGNMAKQGYHKLPGTGANQIGHARFGHAPTGLPPTRSERLQNERKLADLAGAPPLHDIIPLGRGDGGFGAPRAVADIKRTPIGPKFNADIKLSIKHHKASIANDTKHILDHEKSKAKHVKAMNMRLRQLKK